MLFRFENEALSYGGKAVISELNFSVDEGNYLCIVGENGSGKSTVVKALVGLKPVHTGRIIYGKEFSRARTGYLPQQTIVQKDFPASVKEVVLSGCLNRQKSAFSFYTKAQKKLAQENMERMNILDIAKSCYRELSGGQQQRVLLARALCAADNLLVLDEPVAGLDPVVTGEMYSVIKEINQDKHVTVVMVSHDVSAAAAYASHILHIGGDKMLFFGSKDIYTKSDVGRQFLLSKGGVQ